MNKIIAILFLVLLLTLASNRTLSFAQGKLDNSNTIEISDDINANSSSSAHQEEENHENINAKNHEREDDEKGHKGFFAKPTLTQTPTITPTPTITAPENNVITPTPTPSGEHASLQDSKTEDISASFNFIKEIEKLLASLKKAIFDALG